MLEQSAAASQQSRPWGIARLLLRGVVLLCFLLSLAAYPAGGLGFSSSVTPGLIASQVGRFSPAARDRIGGWIEFTRQQKSGPAASAEQVLLQAVNAWVNRVPWVEDQKHWGQLDYWASPSETYASSGGDCEDFAIAKYFMLKELGVPIGRLRITYVRALKINEPHMVLAYYPRPDADPLVLDNLDPRVRPASERSDLIPVYSFNDEDVVVVQGNRKGSALQIRAWRGLIDKLEAEARL